MSNTVYETAFFPHVFAENPFLSPLNRLVGWPVNHNKPE